MKEYTLGEDEVRLFEGCAHEKITNKTYDVMLTNINLVLVHTKYKLFKPSEQTITTYPVTDIKFYNGAPCVKRSKKTVEISFKSCELKLDFSGNDDPRSANKFQTEFINLLTGTSAAQRMSGQVKGAVKMVDDTLGIDTVGTAKSIIENGVGSVVVAGTKGANGQMPKGKLGILTSIIGVTANAIASNKKEKPTDASASGMDEKIETLKKLKELADAGVITQEEYEGKKKQLLNI